MAYTVTKLVNEAYYVSGIVSREFETVQGSQFEDGFNMLNDIITDKAIEKDMIPYYLKYEFNAIAGQEMYFIPDLEKLDTLVFFINDIRYQMREVDRIQYFGSSRANNINSLPFNWHLERCYGGANLFMYFQPNSNYPMQAWGLFRLTEVVLNQDLSLTLDRFYINYLKFALAERLCMEFNFVIPAGVSLQARKYEAMIQSRSAAMDLTTQKMSTLNNGSTLNYGIVNLSGGWTT
jgi:hypothetical protein